MADLNIKLGDAYKVSFNFQVEDMFIKTRLGCHAGTFGSVSWSWVSPKNDGPWGLPLNKKIALFRKYNGARKLMDALVAGAGDAWGGWTEKVIKDWEEVFKKKYDGYGLGGSTYRRKGHWIISSPWKPLDKSVDFDTDSLMAIIYEFCRREPKTYGRCIITPPTDCAAHANNNGHPVTRTMVWMPPYVGVAGKDKPGWKTKFSGLYSPAEPTKRVRKKVEPKTVSAV